MVAAAPIPLIYFPRRDGDVPEPVPYLLTELELIRLLRIDETEVEKPGRTLEYYRRKGLLRATQVGTHLRYQLPDVLEFLGNARELNPR